MPRLGHKKSRLGCRQCKARHVKCDELKPCTNCARHGVPCSLVVWDPNTQQPTASASSAISSRRTNQSPPEQPIVDFSASSTPAAYKDNSRNPSTSAGARAVPTISEEDSSDLQSDAYPFLSRYIHTRQPTQSTLWLRDLELLHHWTTEAFDTLSQRPDHRKMWAVEAPKHASSHDFLMHEILAFAALHKAYQQQEDQRQPYYACGIHHQDLAIRGVRERLDSIVDEEAPAIVATSTLLTLSVFASIGFEAQSAAINTSVDSIDSIIDIFHLMRGMGHVLALAQATVKNSFVGPMLRDAAEPIPPQPILQELKDRHLPELTAFFQAKSDLTDAERKMYLATISYFEPVLQSSLSPRVDTRDLRFLFFWPLYLDTEYIDALRLRKPGAIVILMFFAVVLLAAEQRYWYMEGWGQRVMKDCHKVVDQSWIPAVQWPLAVLDQPQTLKLIADIARHEHSPAPSMGTPSTSKSETPRTYSLELRGTKVRSDG